MPRRVRPSNTQTNHPSMHKPRVDGTQRHWPSREGNRIELADRMKMSKELAQWAPGLVEVIKLVAKRIASESPKVRVLSAKEKEAMKSWQEHVDMNHLPYCRDCGVRVESMSKDRPRRRIKAPEPYTLSLDVGGPFVKGQDSKTKCNTMTQGISLCRSSPFLWLGTDPWSKAEED